MKKVFFLLLAGTAFTGCVTPHQLDLIEREQRRLRSENATILKETVAAREDFERMRSTFADTRANVQQMQRDISALQEKLEEIRHQTGRQIGQSTREGDQRVKDLEARVVKLDEELKAQGALLKAREQELRTMRESLKGFESGREAFGPKGTDLGAELAKERGVGESEAVKRDYDAGLRLLEQRDYRGSIARFKDFLKKYPKSDLADNAQYWIGENHYALKDFDQAILEFDAVRRNYPKGDKVPAALLKQGFAFAELGDKIDARLILQELVDRYPLSAEAVMAKQKLKALES